MDISLTNALISLNTFIQIAETCFGGSMSKNFDIGLSSCFIVCRRALGNSDKKSQKLRVFYHRVKTKV